MGIITPNEKKKEAATITTQNVVSKNLLLIFTRNPELGKCKTRLAATVGDEKALEIYKFLLSHTARITKNLSATKQVWYSQEVWENDIWGTTTYDKMIQKGNDLGARMAYAFQLGFESGYERIIVIGSDMYDLAQTDLEEAFEILKANDYVIGPAQDGGYYLLGMKAFKPELFKNKNWGNDTVLRNTLKDLEKENLHLLDTRNDIDIYDDIKDIGAFQPYLKSI